MSSENQFSDKFSFNQYLLLFLLRILKGYTRQSMWKEHWAASVFERKFEIHILKSRFPICLTTSGLDPSQTLSRSFYNFAHLYVIIS